MRKIYFIFAVMLCMAAFTVQAADWYPTVVVSVAPDEGPPSSGNGALRAAVTATAGPAIYELERGGVYYVGGTCGFGANNSVVRAKAGTGPRPIIVPYTLTGTSNDVFSGSGNLRLENLFVYGQEIGENAPMRRSIHRYTGGTAFEYEGCVFDGSAGASMLRYENLNANFEAPFTITVNNCIFRNSVDYTNVGNSRGIDLRDSKGVTIRVTNSTFYCISAQTIRQNNELTQVDELVFVNNTVYGSAGAFVVGTAEKAMVNNNIFYNPGLNGVITGTGSLISFEAIEYPREVEIRNNLFYRDPIFDALLPIGGTSRYFVELGVDSVIMNGAGRNLLDAGELILENTLNYAIAFKNPPASVLPFYTYLWENNVPNTAIPAAQQTFIRREAPGFIGDKLEGIAPYSFAYPKTSPAATAGVGGTYLGAWKPYEGSGIIPVAKNNLKAWFDASSKILNVAFDSSVALAKVSVFTPAGVLVANQLIAPNGQRTECELTGLSRGVYIFIVEIPDGSMARGKFVY